MKLFRDLLDDEHGFVLSAELVIIATVVVLGMIAGLKCIQVAMIGELTDVGSAIGSLNQSYFYSGFSKWSPFGTGVKAYTRGSVFVDAREETDWQGNSEFGFLSEAAYAGYAGAAEFGAVYGGGFAAGFGFGGALVDAAGNVAVLAGARCEADGTVYGESGLLGRIVLAFNSDGRLIRFAQSSGIFIDIEGNVTGADGAALGILAIIIDGAGNVLEFSGGALTAAGEVIVGAAGEGEFRGTLIGTLGIAVDAEGRTIDFRNTRINAQGNVINAHGVVIASLTSGVAEDGRLDVTAGSRGMVVTTKGDLIDLRGVRIDALGVIFAGDGEILGSVGTVVDSRGNLISSFGILIDGAGNWIGTLGHPDSGTAAGELETMNSIGATWDVSGALIVAEGTASAFRVTLVDYAGRLINGRRTMHDPDLRLPEVPDRREHAPADSGDIGSGSRHGSAEDRFHPNAGDCPPGEDCPEEKR